MTSLQKPMIPGGVEIEAALERSGQVTRALFGASLFVCDIPPNLHSELTRGPIGVLTQIRGVELGHVMYLPPCTSVDDWRWPRIDLPLHAAPQVVLWTDGLQTDRAARICEELLYHYHRIDARGGPHTAIYTRENATP